MRPIRFLAAGGLIAALAMAGCAGQSGAAADRSPTPAEREEAFLKFAQCMREHGIDMPDPSTDAEGNLRMTRPGNVRLDSQADRTKLDDAREACESNLEGIRQEFTPEQRAEMQDNLLKFAQCMRANGVNMPDPDFSQAPENGGGRVRMFGGINRNDPKVQKVQDTCRTEVFGGRDGPGPGRGGIIFERGPGRGGN